MHFAKVIGSLYLFNQAVSGEANEYKLKDLCVSDHLKYKDWPSIDGTDHNEEKSDWGSSFSEIVRLVPPAYSDGYYEIAGKTRPNGRELSNVLCAQRPEDSPKWVNDRHLTQFAWLWGQFIDHDITLIGEDVHAEPTPTTHIDITIPCNDPEFDPEQMCCATEHIEMTRSFVLDESEQPKGPRNQINGITAWIDGGVIYGSDAERAGFIRSWEYGLLKANDQLTGPDYLPYNTDQYDNAPNNHTRFFISGDVRANEQVSLLMMHTLFFRAHNIVARRIYDTVKEKNPYKNDKELDELVYQETRVIITAIIQKITYKDWLPTLFGEYATKQYLKKYESYNNKINPGIASIFASGIFRFGHSMLTQAIPLRDGSCKPFSNYREDLQLADAFFTPSLAVDRPLIFEAIVNGFSCTKSNEVDTRVTEAVRNFLFRSALDEHGEPLFGHLDLAAMNIQRGRDHGLPDYNTVRQALGLDELESFDDLSSDYELNNKFKYLYNYDINDIDLFLGALAEDHLPDGSFGELISKVVLEQFARIRDGDRYYYENYIKDGALKEFIESVTLKDIIEWTTGIHQLRTLDYHNNVFQNAKSVGIHEKVGYSKKYLSDLTAIKTWKKHKNDKKQDHRSKKSRRARKHH